MKMSPRHGLVNAYGKKSVLFGRGVTKKYRKAIGDVSKKRVLFVS